MHSYNKEKTKLPLYLATFKNTDELQNIFQVQSLLSYKIKIENYIRYPRPTQCFKCQKFHHVSKHCHLEAKCVKCAGSHPYTQCTKSKEEDPKCVNCGENHTANYRGCSYFTKNIKPNFKPQKIVNKMFPKTYPNIESNRNFPPLITPKTQSQTFAERIKPKTYNSSPKLSKDTPDDCADILKVLRRVNDLINDFTKNKISKRDALIEVLKISTNVAEVIIQDGSTNP